MELFQTLGQLNTETEVFNITQWESSWNAYWIINSSTTEDIKEIREDRQ